MCLNSVIFSVFFSEKNKRLKFCYWYSQKLSEFLFCRLSKNLTLSTVKFWRSNWRGKNDWCSKFTSYLERELSKLKLRLVRTVSLKFSLSKFYGKTVKIDWFRLKLSNRLNAGLPNLETKLSVLILGLVRTVILKLKLSKFWRKTDVCWHLTRMTCSPFLTYIWQWRCLLTFDSIDKNDV